MRVRRMWLVGPIVVTVLALSLLAFAVTRSHDGGPLDPGSVTSLARTAQSTGIGSRVAFGLLYLTDPLTHPLTVDDVVFAPGSTPGLDVVGAYLTTPAQGAIGLNDDPSSHVGWRRLPAVLSPRKFTEVMLVVSSSRKGNYDVRGFVVRYHDQDGKAYEATFRYVMFRICVATTPTCDTPPISPSP